MFFDVVDDTFLPVYYPMIESTASFDII